MKERTTRVPEMQLSKLGVLVSCSFLLFGFSISGVHVYTKSYEWILSWTHGMSCSEGQLGYKFGSKNYNVMFSGVLTAKHLSMWKWHGFFVWMDPGSV